MGPPLGGGAPAGGGPFLVLRSLEAGHVVLRGSAGVVVSISAGTAVCAVDPGLVEGGAGGVAGIARPRGSAEPLAARIRLARGRARRICGAVRIRGERDRRTTQRERAACRYNCSQLVHL